MSNDYALFLIHVPNDFPESLLGQDSIEIDNNGILKQVQVNSHSNVGEKGNEVLAMRSLCSNLNAYLSSRTDTESMWMISNDKKSYQITFYVEFGVPSDRTLQDLLKIGIGKLPNTKIFVLPTAIIIQGEQEDSNYSTQGSTIADDGEKLSESQINIKNADRCAEENQQDYLTISEKLRKRLYESNFRKSVRARLMVHQVVGSIRAATALSFDFVVLLCLASMIAGFGLLENSTVSIVASMLVSPLMNPILGIVFGLSIREHSLWRRGVRNELIGLALCLSFGFVIGLLTTHAETKWGSTPSFPTPEMRGRGDIKRLWVGVLIALPSGAGVALSVLGGNIGSLVGVAISASLLPPAVNSGLLFAYSILVASSKNIGAAVENSLTADKQNTSTLSCPAYVNNAYIPLYRCDLAIEAAILATSSLLLTIVNILCIIIMALIILRIKEVVPLRQANKDVVNFFHHDIKLARDMNRSIQDDNSEHHNDSVTHPHRGHVAQTIVNQWKRFGLSNSQHSSTFPDTEAGDNQTSQRTSAPRRTNSIINADPEARKTLRLSAFAKEHDLDLSDPHHYDIATVEIREKVRFLVNELIDMSEEMDNVIDDVSRLQPGATQTSFHHEYRLFYQELIESLPPKWLQIFNLERQRRRSPFLPTIVNRSFSLRPMSTPSSNKTIHAADHIDPRQILSNASSKKASLFDRKTSVPETRLRKTGLNQSPGIPIIGTRFSIARASISSRKAKETESGST